MNISSEKANMITNIVSFDNISNRDMMKLVNSLSTYLSAIYKKKVNKGILIIINEIKVESNTGTKFTIFKTMLQTSGL